MTHDVCETFCYDDPKVNRLKEHLAESPTEGMVKIFKALADETRSKIAYALCVEEELCVCDAAHITLSTVANVSHHLRLLKSLGIAKYRKEGKLVFYSLSDERVKQLILLALERSGERAGEDRSGSGEEQHE